MTHDHSTHKKVTIYCYLFLSKLLLFYRMNKRLNNFQTLDVTKLLAILDLHV